MTLGASQIATQTDLGFLARAFMLAKRGAYTCSPNPMVGAVIVRDGVIIGEGWHRWAGEGHAEVNAIASVAGSCAGATIYVTLEPCNHFGKTPPCVNAVIDAGITRVVIAAQDNTKEASGGAKRLRENGVAVDFVGVWPEINPGFIKRTSEGMPFVRLKLAASADARTAMASGESQWITAAPARYQVQKMRAEACAIVTGIGSVAQDDSRLSVRANEWLEPYPDARVRQALRVVVDSSLSIDVDRSIIGPNTLIACAKMDDAKNKALTALGCEVVCLPAPSGQVDLPALLRFLAENKLCNYVMVEAGAKLSGAFVRQNLVDELWVYSAPCLLGSAARPLLELDFSKMSQKLTLQRLDSRQIGNDLLEIYRISGE